MKKWIRIIGGMAVLALVLSLAGPKVTFAATTPSLGLAASYAILSDTYTNTVPGTTVTGDIGFTTGPAVAPAGVHANYGSGAPYASAGVDQGNALTLLAAQPCTFTFAPGAINLSTDITHGPVGVYTPGVYCSNGAMNVGGPLTLNGAGTYIFRPDGALTTTAGSIVTLTGSSACDVFWTPTQATTISANSTFAGTVIDDAGITVNANVTWSGRALAFAGTVSTDTDNITVPTCASAPSSSPRTGNITVVKRVINDSGRTKTIGDFNLFVNGVAVASGITNSFSAPASPYSVTETGDSNYTRTFSGDCDVNGRISLLPGDNKICIITNNDIGAPVVPPTVPPLIAVIKVPSPLALPNGPGPVTYTYTLTNIGTVPVTNITMVGDSCVPIVLVSGDVDSDNQLDLNETWVYNCSTTLSETHTNTIVATGWANGLTATDIASATVVVGAPVVPPLIHITKIPSTLTLLAVGGSVTYTNKVSNPGTVALSNVRVSDDKCANVSFISGDSNNDSKLDPSETWTYVCTSVLSVTTTNTVVASGEANGLTARDFAVATVVVASVVPKLPKTGLAAMGGLTAFSVIAGGMLVAVIALYATRKIRNS